MRHVDGLAFGAWELPFSPRLQCVEPACVVHTRAAFQLQTRQPCEPQNVIQTSALLVVTKKLLGAKGIATRNKCLTSTSSNKEATRSKGHRY